MDAWIASLESEERRSAHVKLKWQSKARSDALRLQKFLALNNRHAAPRMMKSLIAVPKRLLVHPRIGERLEEFEVSRSAAFSVGDYEIRYQIIDETIYVLRLWHTREDR